MLKIQRVMNRELGNRRFFIQPPEPPKELLMNDPADSVYIGKTKLLRVPFYWTYKNLANPHIAVAGVTGCGKSYLVKTILTRASLVWGTNALILDWAGEYVDWVRQVGGKVVRLGKGDSLNLLDLGGMKPADRIKQVLTSLEILTNLPAFPGQKRLIENAMEEAYARKGFQPTEKSSKEAPTLKDVEQALREQARKARNAKREEALEALYRIKHLVQNGSDYFASKSTLDLEKLTTSGLVCIDLHGLPSEEFRSLAGLTILQFLKERMRDEGWTPKKGLKLLVVCDEAWKIASDEKSDVIAIVREGRKYQFGLIVASQNPTDVHKSIFSNCGTLFIMRLQLREFKDYVRDSLGYSDYIEQEIERFGVGDAAVHMIFQTRTRFPQTFVLEHVDGEEPLTPLRLEGIEVEIELEKDELRKRMVEAGLSDQQARQVIGEFEKREHRLDALALVALLEKMGFARSVIIQFLRELGVREADLVKIFARMQKARMRLEADKAVALAVEEVMA